MKTTRTLTLAVHLSLSMVAACDSESASANTRNAQPTAVAQADQQPTDSARRACPPDLSIAPRAARKPVDDILGLRPGMTYEDVTALLDCREPRPQLEVEERWHVSDTHGVDTRQVLRASNGEACTGREIFESSSMGRGDGKCTTVSGFKHLKNVSDSIYVAFNGLPGAEIAGAVWRTREFEKDSRPTVASIRHSLVEKYGEPHDSRPGRFEEKLSWSYDARDRRMSDSNPSVRSCRYSVAASFVGYHSWSEACGLTINALVEQDRSNPLLAEKLHIVVMRQNEFFRAGQQFKEDLAMEKKRRDQAEAAAADAKEVEL